MTRRTLFARIVLALASVGLAGVPVSGTGQATPASTGVVREVIMSGRPEAVPGQILELVRYTIPAGLSLPAHTHPGMQVATIESGTLHYTVLEGEVPLTRAAVDGTPQPDVAITMASGEVAIGPGDSFVEAEGVVHFGHNLGPEPVVILVASLLPEGEPPANVIPATPAN